MKVTLIDYTNEPEKKIAIAARMCYTNLEASEMIENLTEEKCLEMVKKISDVGHDSILEHITFSFVVEGVSRVLTHQLVRHRIASYHQRSQRYVNEGHAKVVCPPSIAKDDKARAIFYDVMKTIDNAYTQLVELGVPGEDARYVLSNATESQMMVTMNVRTLIHFFNLRCCMRAQWEIRRMADAMLTEARKVLPSVFNEVGPSCFKAVCPEGKMSCGQLGSMNTKYRDKDFDYKKYWGEEE